MRYSVRHLLLATALIAVGLAPVSYVLGIKDPDLGLTAEAMLLLTCCSGIFIGAGVATLTRKRALFWIVFFTIAWVPFAMAIFARKI